METTQRLFADSETFQKERPDKITAKQAEDFYKEVAKEIIANQWSSDDLEDVIADVSDISFNDSGYEIAKSLEGFGSNASYDIDTQFIEFLDDLSYRKRKILQKNVSDWATAHNIKPKIAKGAKLLVNKSLHFGSKIGDVVYVNGLSEKEACYLVDKDPNKNGGTVLSYEKVEESCTVLA